MASGVKGGSAERSGNATSGDQDENKSSSQSCAAVALRYSILWQAATNRARDVYRKICVLIYALTKYCIS